MGSLTVLTVRKHRTWVRIVHISVRKQRSLVRIVHLSVFGGRYFYAWEGVAFIVVHVQRYSIAAHPGADGLSGWAALGAEQRAFVRVYDALRQSV